MTELIFLGIGAIRPAIPGDHTAMLLRHGDATILLDAGPAVLVQLDRVGVHPLDVSHVYFSHQHGDHVLGSPLLLFYHRPRVFFGAWQVLEAWQNMLEIVYPGLSTYLEDAATFHPIPADTPHPCPDLPGITARLALVHHNNLPAYALRLDFAGTAAQRSFSLVYSGDTTPTTAVTQLAQGVDLLIHEATALHGNTTELAGVHTSARMTRALSHRQPASNAWRWCIDPRATPKPGGAKQPKLSGGASSHPWLAIASVCPMTFVRR